MSAPTMTDVARRAGVSAATVSRYLAGQRVRQAQAVAKAISDLNFSPSAAARSLKSGQTKTLALVVPDVSNPFFAAVARGVEELAAVAGFTIELHNSGESGDREAEILRKIVGRVDGLILAPVAEDDEIPRQVVKAGVPIVFIDREIRSTKSFSSVLIDNVSGAKQATQHLIEHGHKRIAVIHGPVTSTPGRQRLEGFQQTMKDEQLTVPREFVRDGGFTQNGGLTAMNALLELDEPPTAVLVCNNLMTIGALLAMKKKAIRIPKDISVIGFDEMEISLLLDPPLTVVSRPMEQQGKLAAEMLINGLVGVTTSTSKRVVMPVELIERGSCAPPPQTGSGSRPPGSTSLFLSGGGRK